MKVKMILFNPKNQLRSFAPVFFRRYTECELMILTPMANTAVPTEHRYTVIMAGGTGTRLWPLSRVARPKQFQAFTSEKTLIQETFDRASTTVPLSHIFVSTGEKYTDLTQKQLPTITPEQLIIEPLARNTAPAIIYIAAIMAAHDPEATIATIASDHAIENPQEFTRAIDLAFQTAETNPDALVTIGINPTRPDTNYGYIRMGEELTLSGADRVFHIENFKEKPDQATAEEYLASWEYLWNAGYFIFRASSLLAWIDTYAPELSEFTKAITTSIKDDSLSDEKLMEIFSQVESLPIDTLLAERLPREQRFVVPSALKWSDVGGWHTLYEFLADRYHSSEVIRGQNIDLESKNCFIHGDKRLIVTAGLKDIVVIDTDDAVLIADRETLSRDMKKLLAELPPEQR